MSPPTIGKGTQKKARLQRLKDEIKRFVFANMFLGAGLKFCSAAQILLSDHA